MPPGDWLFRVGDGRCAYGLIREFDDWGQKSVDLARPPARFWGDGAQAPPPTQPNVDRRRATVEPSPTDLLRTGPVGETWKSQSQRSINRLLSWFLICEDPQGRLQAQEVATLAHQASLVQHVLQTPALNRVLIADEVGLGKTIEAGLILRDLLAQQPGLRVLYLAPARLVANVRREFDRLGLPFRIWVAGGERDANLTDPRIVASIHRAAYPTHFEAFLAAPPWDVIVVDECHHLSAWEPGGGNPVQKYKLVDKLQERLSPAGRLILMSGTPHQGHPHRFKNLLELLRGSTEDEGALGGRVIYRTKDDVRDWEGRPLFPGRQVNSPVVLELGESHRGWLRDIHQLFEPHRFALGTEPSQRVAGWRAGQALQWATSSIHAGLGYLVRQAIRAEWQPEDGALRAALESIRPYRGGPANEPADALFGRMAREILRQSDVGDVGDIEEGLDATERWRPDPALLRRVLEEGVALLAEAADEKWELVEREILRGAGAEKVVLFAQPIETVMALAGYIERVRGVRPALIIGNQKDVDRQREIEAFWRPAGPQFLVSSRAGGEGINLQVARRLVHLDVPWNPMEMEQRVGRVHRFGSRGTIIVDTVVVSHSREIDAYRVARGKLAEISRTLVPAERFEGLFSRVMALVPPEELQGILAEHPLGPLNADEQRRLTALVTQGFERWRSFHDAYGDQQRRIGSLDRGEASWSDLRRFVELHLKAVPAVGFSALQFATDGDDVRETSAAADVVEIEGRPFACGDYGGMPVTNHDGLAASRLGLNTAGIAYKLRELGLPDRAAGAAHLRWPAGRPLPVSEIKRPFGVLVLAAQRLRHGDSGWVEVGVRLHGWLVHSGQPARRLDEPQLAELVHNLLDASVRLEPAEDDSLVAALQEAEGRLVDEIRRPSDADRAGRLVNVATPVFAGVLA